MHHLDRRRSVDRCKQASVTGIDAGHKDYRGLTRVAAKAGGQLARSVFALGRHACIMPHIGLLRYGGTGPLDQMRCAIQAIPTFGSVGLNDRGAGYLVSTVPAPDSHSFQFARPAIAVRPARISGRDVAC
jgi:hypothetical protein